MAVSPDVYVLAGAGATVYAFPSQVHPRRQMVGGGPYAGAFPHPWHPESTPPARPRPVAPTVLPNPPVPPRRRDDVEGYLAAHGWL